MKHTLPVFTALALGLAVPAFAQEEAVPPPPDAEPAEAIEEAAPPPAFDAEPGPVPRRERRERPRRPGGSGGAGGPGRGGFGTHKGGQLGFLVPLLQKPETAAKIGLSEEKAQALAATFADLDAQLKAANVKLPAAFEKQARLLEADPVDEAAVLAAVNEVWDLRREVALLQTRKAIAIRAALSAEQIAKARELLRKERGRFGERRGKGGMSPGPGGETRGGPGDRRGPRNAPEPEPGA